MQLLRGVRAELPRRRMKFRTELLDPHPLLKAIRGSAFWQDIIERLVEPETRHLKPKAVIVPGDQVEAWEAIAGKKLTPKDQKKGPDAG